MASERPADNTDQPQQNDQADTEAPTTTAAKIERYSAAEEAALLAESDTLKQSANKLFTIADFSGAITGYERSLASLPTYLDFEIAVLRSNIAACFLKLEEWKRCIEEADKGLNRLSDYEKEVLLPLEQEGQTNDNGDDKIIELGEDEEVKEGVIEDKEASVKHGRDEVEKIRVKLLLRRAKARTQSGGWAALQGAFEDYTTLNAVKTLSPLDRKTVQAALRSIPPRLDEAKTAEMADMMGKLKQLGNGLLRPFGLSTDNFNMVKDEKTGGYNMSFNQGK